MKIFGFETGFYDVMQVSRMDYDACEGGNPFREFSGGPATVSLEQVGVYYFICSLGNYCELGVKVSVVVHRLPTMVSPPLPSPPISRPSP
ncbi:hypothetical protein QJS04_geneDACA009379 [Acorus gramineus]|uniref:Phytocyanin domain-containing protein n=1 Tax=Acorus gramineus TaxID=55184 RepID=A0AAV9AIQ0_ACOGR|nr:hypothetical protein QJS04_geneDACA009379 [Acorus gramineus]